jgi:hypothetical protein
MSLRGFLRSLWWLLLGLPNLFWEVDRYFWNLRHWRLNVVLDPGLILAFVILAVTRSSLIGRIEAVVIFAACLLWAFIWDRSRPRV